MTSRALRRLILATALLFVWWLFTSLLLAGVG
jgi:hypothetical protein